MNGVLLKARLQISPMEGPCQIPASEIICSPMKELNVHEHLLSVLVYQ